MYKSGTKKRNETRTLKKEEDRYRVLFVLFCLIQLWNKCLIHIIKYDIFFCFTQKCPQHVMGGITGYTQSP